jgi:hypothetical protein
VSLRESARGTGMRGVLMKHVKRKDTSFLLYLRRVFCINDAYINQSRSYVL